MRSRRLRTSGVAILIALAGAARTAMMCAEADRKHCHRSLLADVLLARGIAVEHLVDPETREPHRLHPAARVADGRVTYPPTQRSLEGG